MQRRRFLAGLASAGIVGASGRANSNGKKTSRDTVAKIKDRAGAYLNKTGAPGLSIAIGRGDKILFRGAYGLANVERRTLVTTNTRFRIASVSKSITATVLFKLKEQGRIDLDQPVFVDGGPLQHLIESGMSTRYMANVTCRNLLNHTGGAWSQKLHGSDPMFWPPQVSQINLIQHALRFGWWQPAGAEFGYSNFGYCLLGRVIERITGAPYEQATRELVLAPSGAGGMRLDAGPRARQAGNNRPQPTPADEATYYKSFRPQVGGGPIGDTFLNIRRMDADSGWLATAEQLVSFLLRIDNRSPHPDLLTSSTWSEMMRPTSLKPKYAQGWKIDPDHKAILHNGSLPGTMASIVMNADGYCMSALSNARAPGAHHDQFAMLRDVAAVVADV